MVNVTTDKCYENKGWVWGYRETDALGGHDPYSNSKACAELVGRCYRDSFFPPARLAEHGVGIASARAGNVIGGGDWTPRQLVPEAMAAFTRGQPVVLRHPDAVRPWQHVLDCLGGYLRLAEALSADPLRHGGEWNFGPADAQLPPVAAFIEALAAEWGLAQPWQRDSAVHAPEEMMLRLDVSKASHQLGWTPRLPVAEAIRWVAMWYRSFHGGGDARACACSRSRALPSSVAGDDDGIQTHRRAGRLGDQPIAARGCARPLHARVVRAASSLDQDIDFVPVQANMALQQASRARCAACTTRSRRRWRPSSCAARAARCSTWCVDLRRESPTYLALVRDPPERRQRQHAATCPRAVRMAASRSKTTPRFST